MELRDIAQEVEDLPVKTPRWEGIARTDDWPRGNRLGSTSVAVLTPSPPILPVSTEDPSRSFSAGDPHPKEEPGWGLVPLFNSVRSKLESFAEIFLTPVKSRRDAQNLKNGASPGEPNQQECSVTGEEPSDPEPLGEAPGERGPNDPCPVVLHGDGTAEDNLHRTPPHLRLQTPQSPSTLCRPPLHRYLSCPVLPLTRHKWRHSLDTVVHTPEHCTCRRRRHSLGSVEECRNLALIPFTLSCLRKENHPSVLTQSLYPPGDVRKLPVGSIPGEGSPAGLCLDKDQVTKESLPDSVFKTPENLSCSKENKVSNIQIRKRALRQEGNLTPLGLPKRVRLQKEDFSLEEIYTNKNYHTPTEKRKFETIFEEPIMKGGTLILTSQRPLRRIMVFKDGGSAPRKRKKKGKAAGRTRRRPAPATQDNTNYELLLQHKLNQLEAALQEDISEP